jgi:hypothetical protein
MTRRRGGALSCALGGEGNEPSCDSEPHNKSYEGGTKMMSLKGTYFKAMLGASVLLGAVAGLWLSARAIDACAEGSSAVIESRTAHPCFLNGVWKCSAAGLKCANDTGRWVYPDSSPMVGFNCCNYDDHCCLMTLGKRVCKVSSNQECWVRYPRWFEPHEYSHCVGGRWNDSQCVSGSGTP